MMTCPRCGVEPCACHPERFAHPSTIIRSTHLAQPFGITKEEFGLNLYDTVKTIGGIMGIDSQRAQAIHKHEGWKLQDLNRRRIVLQESLARQLPVLNDQEMKQVLGKYPWVTGC